MLRLAVYRLLIPFAAPFETATLLTSVRNTIVVCQESNGVRGWGEAAPWPGQTRMDIDEAWRALSSSTTWSIVNDARDLPHGDAARAALEQAAADHAARSAGEPLWARWRGAPNPIDASAAVGFHATTDSLVAKAGDLVRRGYRSIKLKIEPGRDLEPFNAVRTTFPDVTVAVDANGSYPDVLPSLVDLAGLGPAYIEQPFPAGRDDLASNLRSMTRAVVVADEDIHDDADARRVIAAGAADVVTVKLGRVGVTAADRMIRWARAEGVPVKASGLFETSVGKGHTLALATAPEVRFVDFSPTAEHLAQDVVSDPWQLAAGHIQPRMLPGIGVTIDDAQLEMLATDVVILSGPDTRSVQKMADSAEHE